MCPLVISMAFEALSKSKTLEIEFKTIGQSKNPLWYKERQHRITSSHVGSIVSRKKPITPNFLASLMTFKNLSGIPAVRWGLIKEHLALRDYTLLMKYFVRSCGLFVSSEISWIAASPDGVVYDGVTIGLLEIKCPYSIRTKKPTECFEKLRFTEKSGKLKRNHHYYLQIQTQLYASGYKWCDFVIWTPKGIHVQRIEWNESLWQETVLPKLKSFYEAYWVPAINAQEN